MKFFASKVRNESGMRFDLVVDRKGEWISGECLDIEMSQTMIGIMDEANQGALNNALMPFRAQISEILPLNVENNFSGFLIRKDMVPFKVNSQKLIAHINLLKDQLLIAKFVGPKPIPQAMESGSKTPNHELKGSFLTFSRNVGKGYFFLSRDEKVEIHNALML